MWTFGKHLRYLCGWVAFAVFMNACILPNECYDGCSDQVTWVAVMPPDLGWNELRESSFLACRNGSCVSVDLSGRLADPPLTGGGASEAVFFEIDLYNGGVIFFGREESGFYARVEYQHRDLAAGDSFAFEFRTPSGTVEVLEVVAEFMVIDPGEAGCDSCVYAEIGLGG